MAPRKIAIDTDPGVDDVLAILLALSSPEVEVALITLVFGNTHAPQTLENLRKMYYVLGREIAAVPGARERYHLDKSRTLVAVGEDDPIDGPKHVATYFHGRDGLSNISETRPEFTPPEGTPDAFTYTDKRAYEAILDLLRGEPEGSVTLVALGPLTNLAWAYRSDPKTFSRAREVVWMGGALDVPGNTSPAAEFNSFADPYAHAIMVGGAKKGDFRLVLAPLDITSPHMVSFSDLLHEDAEVDTAPLAAFTTAFLRRVRGLQAKFGLPDAMEMHDPVAVWYAIANANNEGTPSGWTTTPREYAVERTGELTRGMCVVDRRGTGETEGKSRTEDESLLKGDIPATTKPQPGIGHPPALTDAADATDSAKPLPSPSKPNAPPPPADAAQVNLSEGTVAPPPRHLPHAITATPGSDVLRATLLSRVFGTPV